MTKRILLVAVIIITLGIFYSLSSQLFESLKAGDRLEAEATELIKLQNKNLDLKKRLAEVGTLNFIESQARDKLNMSRPGETVFVIPKEEIEKVLGAEIEKKVESLPNWLGWLKLFLK